MSLSIDQTMKGLKKIALFASIPLLFYACEEDKKRGGNDTDNQKTEKKETKKGPQLLEIEGKVFSVPSPIQTAFLLKSSGATYSSDLLNSTAFVSNYTTTDKKAMNLGIFGADLGYATIYDQTQDAISYMAITKRISSELGMTNLFDEAMLTRFESNLGNQDSLLSLVSDAFKSADGYLKSNDQDNLSVLILAGGWIETLHFATNLAKTSTNDVIKKRIGEQKITIKNLINLLLPYQERPETGAVINKLNELNDLYQDIEFKYTFVHPEVDVANKTTTILSESKVIMTQEQLDDITAKVDEIRNSIIK